jgi:hypothetical protein
LEAKATEKKLKRSSKENQASPRKTKQDKMTLEESREKIAKGIESV